MARLAESGEISVNDVVGMYYAVSGIVAVLKIHKKGAPDTVAHDADKPEQGDAAVALRVLPDGVVSEAETFVYGTFDSVIHPKVQKMINDMIEGLTSDLRKDSKKTRQAVCALMMARIKATVLARDPILKLWQNTTIFDG